MGGSIGGLAVWRARRVGGNYEGGNGMRGGGSAHCRGDWWEARRWKSLIGGQQSVARLVEGGGERRIDGDGDKRRRWEEGTKSISGTIADATAAKTTSSSIDARAVASAQYCEEAYQVSNDRKAMPLPRAMSRDCYRGVSKSRSADIYQMGYYKRSKNWEQYDSFTHSVVNKISSPQGFQNLKGK
ncbi:hypothetical protein Scep_016850 [Stephania cephalantha]|uniref:Uncharacterized protein n=1 Tax=Stephania cephalantha TaxID=152367 RepID=A0AAP0IQD6_9MAGN